MLIHFRKTSINFALFSYNFHPFKWLTTPPSPYPQGPQPGQPFKFTVSESCDRMKEEFNFLQAQYHK